jgi:hypothetical protein
LFNTNGSSYHGEWKNGLEHGSGVMTDAKGQKIIGIWANGIKI